LPLSLSLFLIGREPLPEAAGLSPEHWGVGFAFFGVLTLLSLSRLGTVVTGWLARPLYSSKRRAFLELENGPLGVDILQAERLGWAYRLLSGALFLDGLISWL